METLIIGKSSKKFCYLLGQIHDCPKRLYCRGNVSLLGEKSLLTIVGSRQMSEYGRAVVRVLVPKLVEAGFVIVSGMAFGVDAAVHLSCLKAGGKTIAVLAGGVDNPSPKGNRFIYNQILANKGLIISEYPDGKEPERGNFLRRNRIMSGLSRGVVVIEAGMKSGSLATARMAAEQGRDVWAVPGDVTRSNSEGCNWLVSQGAGVVIKGDEIF